VPGFIELGFLLAILFIVFGARRLPRLGERIARALYGNTNDSGGDATKEAPPQQGASGHSET